MYVEARIGECERTVRLRSRHIELWRGWQTDDRAIDERNVERFCHALDRRRTDRVAIDVERLTGGPRKHGRQTVRRFDRHRGRHDR